MVVEAFVVEVELAGTVECLRGMWLMHFESVGLDKVEKNQKF
jgi:hypothetical protein